MKKSYVKTLIFLGLVGSGFAQSTYKGMPALRTSYVQEKGAKTIITKPIQKAAPVWENDFSVNADWTISNGTADNQNWVITNVVSTSQGYGTGSWVDGTNVVSNENGYALFDSDAVGTNGGVQNAFITTSAPINLSMYNNVILTFNQRFRAWQTSEFIVDISNNGGSSWTSYPVNVGKPLSVAYEEYASVNITSAAGGQSAVLVRFTYKGSWDYMWAVDDVAIFEQPANDVRMISGYFVGSTNEGAEYGRTPINQLDASYLVGAQVNNFGYSAQTNVEAFADFGSFTSNIVFGTIQPEDTLTDDNTITPALAVGVYDGEIEVNSDEEVAPDYLDNNLYLRSFEITNDLYSLDGIGVYPQSISALSSLGTNSFENNADGIYLATMYHIKQLQQVKDVQIMITNSTVAGGSINVHLFDTTDILNNDISQPIVSLTDVYDLTATDITNGFVTVSLPPTVLAPGAYYVAVELFSNGNTSDIRILDDQTLAQPAAASVIWLPNGTNPSTTFTNGEALAIRLKESSVGVTELNALEGVYVYPNPSNGLVNVSNELNTENTIIVRDLTGKTVLSQVSSVAVTLDLTSFAKGTYMVEVANAKGSKIEKIVLR